MPFLDDIIVQDITENIHKLNSIEDEAQMVQNIMTKCLDKMRTDGDEVVKMNGILTKPDILNIYKKVNNLWISACNILEKKNYSYLKPEGFEIFIKTLKPELAEIIFT